MAISYINTYETRKIGEEIVDLSRELDNKFDKLFKRLSDVPTVTKEWTGTQADFYFNRVLREKKQYVNFAEELKKLGYKISNDVYEIQTCINSNRKIEQ